MFRSCFFVEATAFSIIYMLKKMLVKRKGKNMGEKIISLGLISDRHDMPVDGYVLESVPDVADMPGIHKAVFSSLEKILGPYIHLTTPRGKPAGSSQS